MCRASETPIDRVQTAIGDMPGWLAHQDPRQLGDFIRQSCEAANRLEAMKAEAIRRFEKARGYEADGALGMVPWLREQGKMSGGQAAERVEVARQLGQLPRTEEALAHGEIGYEHALAMARTASHVGVAAVRKAEVGLLKEAESKDPAQFVTVVKQFEHQVDAEAALAEANRAHERRYLHIGVPTNGLVRLEGQLTTEQGAIVRTAIEPYMKPSKHDERTPAQRAADALTEACRGAMVAGRRGAQDGSAPAPRVQLIIKATVDTLAKTHGAPAGELEWGGTVPTDTARRYACDCAITRIIGLGEFEQEISRAARTTPPAMRRGLIARDHHCVVPGCDRPPAMCDAHHLIHWADGGPTKLDNLGLVCRAHHRKFHEEGWTLRRDKDGRWHLTPPPMKVVPQARSA